MVWGWALVFAGAVAAVAGPETRPTGTPTPATTAAGQSADALALLQAAARGDTDQMKTLLAAGAHPNARRPATGQIGYDLTPEQRTWAGPGTTQPASRPLVPIFRSEGEWAMLAAAQAAWQHDEYPLHAAVFHGHRQAAQLLLDARANPNLALANGDTPLHFVRSAELQQLLLARGADVRARDAQGQTPLFRRVLTAQLYELDRLLEAGADPAAADAKGRTALVHAVTLAHENYETRRTVLLHLLAAGAPVNARDENGRTALHPANAQVTEILLEAGARPHVNGLDGITPLHLAAQAPWGQTKAAALLRCGAVVNAPDAAGNRPLHEAARAGQDEMLLVLLAHQADPVARNAAGQTALDVAIQAGQYRTARLLAQRLPGKPAVDPLAVLPAEGPERQELAAVEKIADRVGASAKVQRNDRLLVAASRGHLAVVEKLLDLGVDVNAISSSYGRTALSEAASRGHYLIVKTLLDAGAKVDLETKWPTALQAAVGVETARLLLAVGADPNRYSLQDTGPFARLRPLDIAVERGDFAMVDLLLQNGAKVNQAGAKGAKPSLGRAIVNGQYAIVRRLLEAKDLDFSEADQPTGTALNYAVRYGPVPLAQAIADRGADVNGYRGGWCPLGLAAAWGRIDMMRMLLAAGAQPHRPADPATGREAVDVIFDALHHPAAVELLLEHGAKPNVSRYAWRETPLHVAVRAGLADSVRVLLRHGADPNAKDTHGYSPRDLARLSKQTALVELLQATATQAATQGAQK